MDGQYLLLAELRIADLHRDAERRRLVRVARRGADGDRSSAARPWRGTAGASGTAVLRQTQRS